MSTTARDLRDVLLFALIAAGAIATAALLLFIVWLSVAVVW